MLWEVKNTNLYIIGSVHVSDRQLNLSEQETEAIHNASIIAFEANLEASSRIAYKSYSPPDRLSNHIPASLYVDARQIWHEHGFNIDELDTIPPWRAALIIMNSVIKRHGYTHDLGIERCIKNITKKKKESYFYLESPNASLAPYATGPNIEQEAMLADTIYQMEQGLKTVANIVTAFETNEPQMLLPVIEKSFKLTPVIQSNLLANRNKAWLRHIVRFSKSKSKTVAVVGALHMVCPDNIQKLLASEGFDCVHIN